MQAVNDTFSEVYDNMETLDGRIDALEHKTDAAYLGKNNKDIAAKSACGTPQALILYAERQEI